MNPNNEFYVIYSSMPEFLFLSFLNNNLFIFVEKSLLSVDSLWLYINSLCIAFFSHLNIFIVAGLKPLLCTTPAASENIQTISFDCFFSKYGSYLPVALHISNFVLKNGHFS